MVFPSKRLALAIIAICSFIDSFNYCLAQEQTSPESIIIEQLERQAPELFLLLGKNRLRRNLSIVMSSAAKGEIVSELPSLEEPGGNGPNLELIRQIAKPFADGQANPEKIIAHIIGPDGKKIIEPEVKSDEISVPNKAIRVPVNFKSDNSLAPVLPKCEENQTILVEKRSEVAPIKLIDDLLILAVEPPNMATEIFGNFTRVMHYKGGTNDPQSKIMAKMGLLCLPFRIRNYQEASFQDMGLNALANFDLSAEKADFHEYVKDKFKELLRN